MSMILPEPAITITRNNVEIKRRTISLTGFWKLRPARSELAEKWDEAGFDSLLRDTPETRTKNY
jgi:hypothetical protein